MRSVGRRLLNLATVLSLLVLLTIVWLTFQNGMNRDGFKGPVHPVLQLGERSFWLLGYKITYGAGVLVAAVLPAYWGFTRLYLPALRRQRMRERKEAGLCPSCSYDLRATPGRCPECGTTAAAADP